MCFVVRHQDPGSFRRFDIAVVDPPRRREDRMKAEKRIVTLFGRAREARGGLRE